MEIIIFIISLPFIAFFVLIALIITYFPIILMIIGGVFLFVIFFRYIAILALAVGTLIAVLGIGFLCYELPQFMFVPIIVYLFMRCWVWLLPSNEKIQPFTKQESSWTDIPILNLINFVNIVLLTSLFYKGLDINGGAALFIALISSLFIYTYIAEKKPAMEQVFI
ncbi:Uncharacterised protein [Phocoenobacter uteri]|uniref:Uncharacterized protein n=1 Tax=Phocoenobacter uteri TaxID=146806 RepID=A0A379CC29_9PAST|nr:hypothetical protein [Phocoenobacter uteri]MDG6881251.1 hypothetical protein [Phocoenobacter uteri]SUB59275.1 Uncharacterised protein [Phocoenobacter uteri]